MPHLDSPAFAVLAAQLVGTALLAITFLHSGLDMALDRAGNLTFLGKYFARTRLKKAVPLLLTTIVVMEVVSGALCVAGVVELLVDGHRRLATLGALGCGACLAALLLGQKLAKDHPGSASLMGYCAVTLLTLLALAR